jgi:hypothetical protein
MPGVRCNFTVDASGFSRSLARYATLVQNGAPRSEIVRNQMKFAVRAIIDLTPFETLAQGRAVVRRDLLLAMHPYGGEDGSFSRIRNDSLRNRLRNYLRNEDYDKIKEVWSKIGARSGLKMMDFSEALHHSAQDRRGHVNSDKGILVPQINAWNAYLDKLRAAVGRARGGWAASAAAFGLSLPAWITRHISGGSVSAQIDPGRVTFRMVNRSVFIPRYQETVELALLGRQKAMETDLRRWLAGLATYAGFSR